MLDLSGAASPFPQASQLRAPFELAGNEYVPARQFLHVEALVWPVPDEYMPISQALQF